MSLSWLDLIRRAAYGIGIGAVIAFLVTEIADRIGYDLRSLNHAAGVVLGGVVGVLIGCWLIRRYG